MSEVLVRPETEFFARPAMFEWRGVDQVEGEITIISAPFQDGQMRRMAAAFFSHMETGVALGHESAIAGRIDQLQRRRPGIIAAAGSYTGALRAHYGVGTSHPDDQNLPLDKWDETE